MEYILLSKSGQIEDWKSFWFKNITELKGFLKENYGLVKSSLKNAISEKAFVYNEIQFIIEETSNNVYELSLTKLQSLIQRNCTNIKVLGFKSNGPACEEYIHTVFSDNDYSIETMVPYVYRRSNLELFDELQISSYLIDLERYFKKSEVIKWMNKNNSENSNGDTVYSDFLRILINSGCREVPQNKFPKNNNPQKIIQAIKDNGFVLSVLRGTKNNGYKTRYWILPLPRINTMYYETMSRNFRNKVKAVFNRINAYENKKTNPNGLLPDHKFPEIRWDETTYEDNFEDISEPQIRQKFQLLDTQRNQQKREVCRACKKTQKRGEIFGIKYFYKGTEDWDPSIPQIGKDAEKGCEGCPWYDIQEWRLHLQELIDSK